MLQVNKNKKKNKLIFSQRMSNMLKLPRKVNHSPQEVGGKLDLERGELKKFKEAMKFLFISRTRPTMANGA